LLFFCAASAGRFFPDDTLVFATPHGKRFATSGV
jgi:hypothetical protein